MSNWKHGYGWVGHILVPHREGRSAKKHNVIAIDNALFDRIAEDYGNSKIPKPIEARQLGVTSCEVMFLAVGFAFSEGFENYGTIFEEAEERSTQPSAFESDTENKYRNAMHKAYGLTLPFCRMMVGCSSEH